MLQIEVRNVGINGLAFLRSKKVQIFRGCTLWNDIAQRYLNRE